MSLSLALNNALSGINVAQNSLSVLSNNVANANTVGYSRQVAEQVPMVVGSQGAGARIEQIVRKIDEYLNRAVKDQTSEVGRAQVLSDYMSRVQVLMGQPGAGNSLDVRIENFFNVLQTLADAPELVSARAQVVNAGETLARELSALAGDLESLRYQAEQDIQGAVSIVNDELLRLYDLNESIHRAASLGEPVANFLDRRDVAVNKIAEYIDLKTLETDDGQISLYTTAGIALLEHIPYQLQYRGINNEQTLINDGLLPSITVDGIREDGTPLNRPVELVSSGVDADITTSLVTGKLKGLLELRDKEIPNILAQLDNMAATLRDQFNAVHNSGSGIPGAATLTGGRAVGLNDPLEWTGSARIAVLNEDGTAVDSRYNSSDAGFLALDLNFDALRSEFGDQLTTQTIINEINSHFQPQNKAVVGNMNNIALSAISNTIPVGTSFEFDLELENISNTNSNLWVNNITVLDSGGAPQAYTSTAPVATNFDAVGTFDTTIGSNIVTVNAAAHGLSTGDVIYMSGVNAAGIGGIPAADFNGQAFKITVLDANRYTIEATGGNNATIAGPTTDAGAQGQLAYAQQEEGVKSRTSDNGTFTLDLSANPASPYYLVQMDVMVEDDAGNLVNSTIEYRINNNQTGTVNKRFAPSRIVAGAGTVEVPNVGQPLLRAEFVDTNGNVPKSGEDGYLRLRANNVPGIADQFYAISIDDLSSRELGLPNDNPPEAGSDRGFSHYFELNNFFVSNQTTRQGDTVAGSALNLAMRQDIIDNPNLLSMGSLTRTPNPSGSGLYPDYSYERTVGDNRVAQMLAGLGLEQHAFSAAGGLASSIKSFNGYASEIQGYAGGRASSADVRLADELTLLEGFQERADSVSGVNIDEEMANTIIFQNAYSASSQVIRVVKELFDTLLSTF